MKNKICFIIYKSFLLLFVLLVISCQNGNKQSEKNIITDKDTIPKGQLVIFHAGSMAMPLKEIITAFNGIYPDVKILTEAAGSVACARKITDLNKICDVFISADYGVINTLLIPQYAEWNIKFAGNEMAIVYNEKSKYADKINSDNWHHVLLKDDVRYGRSDPNADPCGYRTVLTAKLSEKHYAKKGFASTLLEKHHKYIRPKEVDLLALLETGSVDYIFLYRSVAVQHNLQYIKLPDEINLKNDSLAELYAQVSIEINGSKPAEKEVVRGEPMAYGITIPKDAPNKKAALLFVKFMLSEKGQDIMEKNGQHSLIPSISDTYNAIPEDLKKYAKKE